VIVCERVALCETFVSIYKTTPCHNLEDHSLKVTWILLLPKLAQNKFKMLITYVVLN
jgi:hypothetical protein